MIQFTTIIKQFAKQGEKTGWTYIDISRDIANELAPGNRKGFRVKGKLDKTVIKQIPLLPMGGGNFILTLNAAMRKKLLKKKGAMLEVAIEIDTSEKVIPRWILDCLRDEPDAYSFFATLPRGHQNYFISWIESAKTETTKAKRMAMAVNSLARKWGYGEMIRANKKSDPG